MYYKRNEAIEKYKEIVELRNSGLSMRDISRTLRINNKELYSILRKAQHNAQ